jgi:hypothetical protein
LQKSRVGCNHTTSESTQQRENLHKEVTKYRPLFKKVPDSQPLSRSFLCPSQKKQAQSYRACWVFDLDIV